MSDKTAIQHEMYWRDKIADDLQRLSEYWVKERSEMDPDDPDDLFYGGLILGYKRASLIARGEL